jgi:hypothetical protein
MDIEKIKELALANGFKLKEQASGNMDLNAYVYDFANAIEQAAKAHEAKKLEGCVVVPVQCPDPDFADSLFDELSKKAIGEFGDDLLIHFSDIDEEKIWALIVEVAKAKAVPDGFVVVPKEPTDAMYQAYARHSVAPMSTLSKTGYKAMLEAARGGNE